MKKTKVIIIVFVVLIILIGLFLLGYTYFNQENVIKAQVININDNVVTVKSIDDNNLYTFTLNNNIKIIIDNKKVYLQDLNELSMNLFNNAIIDINYKGNIKETSPAQITNVTKIKLNIESDPNIVVYLEKDTTEEERNYLIEQINKIENIKSIEFKSKEEWKEELINNSDIFEEVLDNLSSNPLLDSLIINISDYKYIDSIVETIKKMPKVEDVK